jgi:peptidoglycan/LPS O-acetylase OafA/YrhL
VKARLEFLEGIRGLTALYVVLFHISHGFLPKPESFLGKVLFRIAAFGHEAVAIFIVLSGFCLTLSLANSRSSKPFDVDAGRFFLRRAQRILPPYYAALGLSWLAIATLPVLASSRTGTIWDDSHPAFSSAAVVSHLLLLNNWSPELKFTVNGPLWSVATEWQIYFLFPTLLVPIRRRFGPIALLIASAIVGYGAWLLFPRAGSAAVTWYVLLFALGVCACLGTRVPGSTEYTWLSKWPLPLIACALVAGVGLFGLGLAQVWFRFQPLSDLLTGLGAASAIAALASTSEHGRRSLALRVLEHPLLVGLGRMSYSLYLTHLPIVAVVALGFRNSLGERAGMLTVVTSLALSLLFAFAFFQLIERPILLRMKVRSS